MKSMTKARSLERLAGVLNFFKIPLNIWFDVNTWNNDSDALTRAY